MADIFIILTFQPFEKKTSYRSLSYKKETKLPEGSIYSGAFLRKLQTNSN